MDTLLDVMPNSFVYRYIRFGGDSYFFLQGKRFLQRIGTYLYIFNGGQGLFHQG